MKGHTALAFPDFVGLLVGLGLEQYRKGNATAPEAAQEEAPDNEDGEGREADPLRLFDMDPRGLHDLFNEFDEAMERTDAHGPGPRIRLVNAGELA